jgi:hypothetical protein
MTDITPFQMRNNCALGEDCTCAAAWDCADGPGRYWECPNWARSPLPCAMIGHTDSHYGVMSREQAKRHADTLHKRQRRQEDWLKQTNTRLGEVRHADPRAHLRKKGVKI